MRKHFLSLLTVLSIIVLIGAVATPAVMADSSTTNTGGEDLFRWAELEVITEDEIDNETVTTMEHNLNMTVPETMAENHTLEGTLSVEHFNGSTIETTNWVNVTMTNESGAEQKTFTREMTLEENETRDFTLDTDFPEDDNCSVEISYEHDASSENPTVSLDSDVIDSTEYNISVVTTNLITQLIPLFIVVGFLIPVLKSLMKGIGKEGAKATGGKY